MNTKRRSIDLLPAELQNQIAAGEVVERPASVVKELVENALDANATQINIYLENGGQGCIKVQDNGHGIAKEELELALTRHATSKIQKLNDLLAIYSYGFRGEALPSIASVSRFSITSALSEQGQTQLAHCLQVEYGSIKSSTPAALPRGTVIEVRDIFANIPARLKFLKSQSTENKKAQDWLSRLAIAKTEVGFNLNIGGREVLKLAPMQSLKERLDTLWPPLIMQSMRPFDASHHGIRAHGMAALPQVSQPRADRILLYVNGRSVQDKTLLVAVREAYKGRLTTKDYPQAVVFIEINPEEIDVNVHPAKTEVRFRDSSTVFSAVRRSLQHMLEQYDMHNINAENEQINQQNFEPNYIQGSMQNYATTPHTPSFTPREQGFWGNIDNESIINARKIPPPNETLYTQIHNHEIQPPTFSTSYMTGLQEDTSSFGPCLESNTSYELYKNESAGHTAQHIDDTASAINITHPTPEAHQTYNASTRSIGNLEYLGQIDDTYLILKLGRDTLLLIDQHAAHERILFARMQAQSHAGQGQLLALPLVLDLHTSELERALELRNDLETLGFNFELQEQSLNVLAIPSMLEREEAKVFLREVFAGRKDDLDALLISFACKAAIKARQRLTHDEIMGLVKQWLETEDREFCPHGRPCVLRFSAHELEKMFKRK